LGADYIRHIFEQEHKLIRSYRPCKKKARPRPSAVAAK
jgi:hypothetical protein